MCCWNILEHLWHVQTCNHTLMQPKSAKEVINILNQHTKIYSNNQIIVKSLVAPKSNKNSNYIYHFFLLPFSFSFIICSLHTLFLKLQEIHLILKLTLQIVLSIFFFKVQTPNLGVTIKPLKMIESICCFYGCLPTDKNQHRNPIISWFIADPIFRTTFGIPRCAWTKWNRCI